MFLEMQTSSVNIISYCNKTQFWFLTQMQMQTLRVNKALWVSRDGVPDTERHQTSFYVFKQIKSKLVDIVVMRRPHDRQKYTFWFQKGGVFVQLDEFNEIIHAWIRIHLQSHISTVVDCYANNLDSIPGQVCQFFLKNYFVRWELWTNLHLLGKTEFIYF